MWLVPTGGEGGIGAVTFNEVTVLPFLFALFLALFGISVVIAGVLRNLAEHVVVKRLLLFVP